MSGLLVHREVADFGDGAQDFASFLDRQSDEPAGDGRHDEGDGRRHTARRRRETALREFEKVPLVVAFLVNERVVELVRTDDDEVAALEVVVPPGNEVPDVAGDVDVELASVIASSKSALENAIKKTTEAI